MNGDSKDPVLIGPLHPVAVVRGIYKYGGPVDETGKNQGSVSQQVMHDKYPPLLKDPEHRA
jgi:hypothetical protein